MIRTEDRERKLIELITHANGNDENCVIEYKAVPHLMKYECEFYKDILALLNSYDRPIEDRWLIYGVNSKTLVPIGFDAEHGDLLDDASYQEKFRKISPRPVIELITVDGEKVLDEKGKGKKFAAFYIPSEKIESVYELNTTIKDKEVKPQKTDRVTYNVGTGFVRYGSSTQPLREEDRVQIRAIVENKKTAPATTSTFTAGNLDSDGTKNVALTLTSPIDNLRLLGSWDERNKCDKRAIAELCGRPYEQVVRMLQDDLDKGLFAVQKSTWTVQDKVSMVESVASHLTGASLEALATHFGGIISSVDEMYAMPEDRRIMADITGVGRGCSQAARKGAASLCAILANNPRFAPNCTKRDIDAFVSKVMMPVFTGDDWRVIASAESALPLLAQASPSTFLSHIGISLKNSTAIIEFLNQETGGIASVKLGWGLMCGIRIAAMKEDCMARAIVTLTQLSPYSDMAKEAIVAILLPWLPQTEAPVASRKGMGSFLARQAEPEAWQALLELLPNRTTSAMGPLEPEYLEVRDLSNGVSASEFWDVSLEYCRNALEGARGHFGRIHDLIDSMNSFKSAGMIADVATLVHDEASLLNDMEKYEIWNELQSYVERCKRFADADWVPSEDELRAINAAIDDVMPDDVYYQALRACSLSDYDLACGTDIEVRHEAALAQRKLAVKPLYDKEGLAIAERLVGDGAKGGLVGETLAAVGLADDDEQPLLSLLDLSVQGNDQRVNIARSYIGYKFRLLGWEWVDSVSVSEWPSRRIAQFYAALPFTKKCWSDAERLLDDQASLYWEEIPYAWVIDNAEDVAHCVKQLLHVGRAVLALESLQFSIHEGVAVDADVVLEAISNVSGDDVDTMCAYYIKELLEYVEETAPSDNLCVQELRFAELLDDKPDAYLFIRMSEDCDLFVQVAALAYAKPQSDDEQDGSLSLKRWRVQYHVLRSWVIVPGLKEDGTFDELLFESWLAGTLEKAESLGILNDVEREVGRNSFYAPQAKSGFFMPEAIALFIENSEAALDGFELEAFNSRGVHFVDPTGKQEDEIADSYEKKAAFAEGRGYVKLAAGLRAIAKSYRQEAEDNRNG